jgi:hypothetical protein
MGTNGQVESTLEGLIFRRSTASAAARGVSRLHEVAWADVEEATFTRSRKGKPVVRVQVVGAAATRRRHDPHAVKVKRSMAREARDFVDLVNGEVATRRQWKAASGS